MKNYSEMVDVVVDMEASGLNEYARAYQSYKIKTELKEDLVVTVPPGSDLNFFLKLVWKRAVSLEKKGDKFTKYCLFTIKDADDATFIDHIANYIKGDGEDIRVVLNERFVGNIKEMYIKMKRAEVAEKQRQDYLANNPDAADCDCIRKTYLHFTMLDQDGDGMEGLIKEYVTVKDDTPTPTPSPTPPNSPSILDDTLPIEDADSTIFIQSSKDMADSTEDDDLTVEEAALGIDKALNDLYDVFKKSGRDFIGYMQYSVCFETVRDALSKMIEHSGDVTTVKIFEKQGLVNEDVSDEFIKMTDKDYDERAKWLIIKMLGAPLHVLAWEWLRAKDSQGVHEKNDHLLNKTIGRARRSTPPERLEYDIDGQQKESRKRLGLLLSDIPKGKQPKLV